MQDAFSSMEVLLGRECVNKLAKAKIAVFGVGSVGSYVAETLARCGIGSLTLVDSGTVKEAYIGHQLNALHSNIGKSKVQMLKERIQDIDQDILIHTYESFFNADTVPMFDLSSYDYVVAAIGDVQNKLLLIEKTKEVRTPILSCMGVSGRMDPLKFEIADISRTRVCPVAKVIRTELRKKGLRRVKVLYSKELPISRPDMEENDKKAVLSDPGIIAYMPGAAGMLIVREVVKDLLAEGKENKNPPLPLKRVASRQGVGRK